MPCSKISRTARSASAHGTAAYSTRGAFGAWLDILAPDGTHLRFIWQGPGALTGFIRTVFEAGAMSFYDSPRLDLDHP